MKREGWLKLEAGLLLVFILLGLAAFIRSGWQAIAG